MADATTAARARIDRALAALERKVNDLKARPATARPLEDDDLFAIPSPVSTAEDGTNRALLSRIADLEAAGRDASLALGFAIDELATNELGIEASRNNGTSSDRPEDEED